MESNHMAKLTAQQMSAKWKRNYTGAQDSMKAGAMAVTVSPAQAAVQQKDRYIQGVTRAYNDGTWERACMASTLQQWQQAYINKGIANAQQGATSGQQKWEQHETAFRPIRDSIIAGLPPRGTDADNDNRMLQFVRAMRATKGQ
jgi:hypothetical protein